MTEKTIVRTFRGPCPETGKQQQIAVEFWEIPSFQGFKKRRLICPYAEEHGCAAKGDTGADCPVYRKAEMT